MASFLSDAWPFAAAILVILGIVVLALIVVILMRVNKTMKSVEHMAAEADKEITPVLAKVDPMVDKAELTIDTLNLEMLRVDAILEDVEQISSVAGKTATTVDTVTSAPADAVSSIVGHLRGTLSSKRKEQVKQARVVYPIGAGKQEAKDGEKAEGLATDDSDLSSKAADLATKVAAQKDDSVEKPADEAEPKNDVQDAEVAGKHSVKAATDDAEQAAV